MLAGELYDPLDPELCAAVHLGVVAAQIAQASL